MGPAGIKDAAELSQPGMGCRAICPKAAFFHLPQAAHLDRFEGRLVVTIKKPVAELTLHRRGR